MKKEVSDFELGFINTSVFLDKNVFVFSDSCY